MESEAFLIYDHKVTNIYRKPLRIVSGEYPKINNMVIDPGGMLRITVAVPQGFKPYSAQYMDIGEKPVTYLGYIDDEV